MLPIRFPESNPATTRKRVRLTSTLVRTATLAHGSPEQLVFDEILPGFGLRLRAGGSKTWVVQYRLGSKQRRMKLGTPNLLTLEAARRAARIVLAEAAQGRDPQESKRKALAQASVTLGALLEPYLAHRLTSLRPRSFLEVRRHLQRHCKPLHSSALKAITRREIAEAMTAIAMTSGNVTSDRVRASLSAFFGWTIREGLLESNPVSGTAKKAGHVERDRVLTDDELRHIWRASGPTDFGALVRFLMLLPVRRSEAGGISFAEIDLSKATWTIPAARSKNGLPCEMPLVESAISILKSNKRPLAGCVFGSALYGFTNWGHSKKYLDTRIFVDARKTDPDAQALPHWTLHDLRRTIATRLAELGTPPHIIEELLNHRGGHKAGVAGVYNRARYVADKRRALEMWALHLDQIVAPRDCANAVASSRKSEPSSE